MIILIDDIKIRNEQVFIPYIDINIKGGKIDSLDSLADYLGKTDEEIEFLVSDFNDVPEEEKDFASRVLDVLLEAKKDNPNIKLTMM